MTDPLAKAELLAVAALEMKTSPLIRMAAPLDVADLPAALAAQIKETVETSLDPVSGSVLARRRKRLGALVLEERSAPPDAADAAAALLEAVRSRSVAPALDGRRAQSAGAAQADAWAGSRHLAGLG